MRLLAAAAAAAAAAADTAPRPALFADINIANGADYRLLVGGEEWMRSPGTLAAYTNGGWDADAAPAAAAPEAFGGCDAIGCYNATRWGWTTNSSVRLITTIRQYQDAVVFSLGYPDGATMTDAKTHDDTHGDDLSANFPSFGIGGDNTRRPGSLGYLSWGGNMCNHSNVPHLASVSEGGYDTGGPLVLYERHDGAALVISPLNNFMTAEWTINQRIPSLQGGRREMTWGPGGLVRELPPGYAHETIATAAQSGITNAMLSWGRTLRNATGNVQRLPDKTLSHLGVWTDHGAYFYFYNGKPKIKDPAETVLLALHDSYKKAALPVSYYQLDAWWNQCTGYNACMQLFEPAAGYFNQSLRDLMARMGDGMLGWSLYHNYVCPVCWQHRPLHAHTCTLPPTYQCSVSASIYAR